MAKPPRAKAPREVPEEALFQEYDAIADRIAGRLGRFIERMFRRASAALDENRLAAAQSFGSPSLVAMAAPWDVMQAQFEAVMVPPPPEETEAKARKPSLPLGELDPSGLVQQAVDAGIELGIRTLPTKAAREAGVDLGKARARAYRTLNRDLIKQSLRAIRDSRAALEMLVDHPKHLMGDTGAAVRGVLDGEMLKKMFGLTKQQAQTMVREIGGLVDGGKMTRAQLRQYAMRRYRQMLKARIDMLAKTIANEAINKGQRAAWAEAKAAGDLDAGFVKEWVARVLPCPRCLAFDGKRAPIDKPFVSDLGETAMEPEIHPRGRCRMRLVKPRTAAGTTERSRRLRRSA